MIMVGTLRRTRTELGPLSNSVLASTSRKRAGSLYHPRRDQSENVDPFNLCGYLQESSDWPWLQHFEPGHWESEDDATQPTLLLRTTRHTFDFDYSASDSGDEDEAPQTPRDSRPPAVKKDEIFGSDRSEVLEDESRILFKGPTRAALGNMRFEGEKRASSPGPWHYTSMDMVAPETLEEVLSSLRARHEDDVATGSSACAPDQLFLAESSSPLLKLGAFERVLCVMTLLL
ncbi:hypothetical protein BKA62DRAFT_692647 [Auriculariales sp. MPI-PUGE-AT-0066]|nr:hypothetical protein BKA62DRAFT_692647 [Auriculariales sp. MPI-PUGE-AT-0066]